MQVGIDTSAADERIKKLATYLGTKPLARALARSLNRAGAAGRTALNRGIRKELPLKAATVRDAIEMERATPADLSIDYKVERRPLSLKEFGARQTARGVTARVKRGGRRSLVRSAFIAKKLGEHAFVRVSSKRLPIKKLFGPSIGSQADKAWPDAHKRAVEVLEQRTRHEIQRAVDRANR